LVFFIRYSTVFCAFVLPTNIKCDAYTSCLPEVCMWAKAKALYAGSNP